MNFGNNIEAMGFEKSGWSKIATSDNITYMGKPMTPDALDDDPVWTIKKIEKGGTGKDGFEYITITYSQNRVKWNEREKLTYKYFWI
ncbi:MAG: hypothetical protein IKU01_02500 [Bacteroidales bacterium]|nr:hypothetical protein [Bacteroidales bacterium]